VSLVAGAGLVGGTSFPRSQSELVRPLTSKNLGPGGWEGENKKGAERGGEPRKRQPMGAKGNSV